jgi:hypothetical protein
MNSTQRRICQGASPPLAGANGCSAATNSSESSVSIAPSIGEARKGSKGEAAAGSHIRGHDRVEGGHVCRDVVWRRPKSYSSPDRPESTREGSDEPRMAQTKIYMWDRPTTMSVGVLGAKTQKGLPVDVRFGRRRTAKVAVLPAPLVRVLDDIRSRDGWIRHSPGRLDHIE